MSERKSQNGGAAPPPASRGVGFMLSTLGYAVSRRFQHLLAPLGLQPSEFAVLRAVGLAEGQSQHALADRLTISPSRMVAIVDELEARGVLERRPQPGDRRVRTLHLTRAGTKLLSQASRLAREYEGRISEPLSERERVQLLDLLERVGGGLEVRTDAHEALRERD